MLPFVLLHRDLLAAREEIRSWHSTEEFASFAAAMPRAAPLSSPAPGIPGPARAPVASRGPTTAEACPSAKPFVANRIANRIE